MKNKLKIFLKKAFPFVCIALVSILALSLIWNKNYYSGHDFKYHAASIASMADGDFFDIFTGKVYGVISNDLGYGEGLFYPPLAHTVAAVIYKVAHHFFGAGVYFSMKVTYFLILFFAGVFMRKLILLITKNQKAALFAAFFYITFPYLLVDVIVRCAMAECTMFVFMPVVLIGLYKLMHEEYKSFLIYFTIGCIGLIHSHLVLTLFFVIFCIIAFLPKIKLFLTKKKILYLLLSAVITGLVSLPFLVPLLQQKMTGIEYYVFKPDFMTNIASMQAWRVSPSLYLTMYGSIIGVPVYITFLELLAVIYAVLRYKEVRTNGNKAFLIFSIIFTVLGLVCTTTLFSWELVPSSLLLLQFPWRLLSFVALGGAIVVGIVIPKLEKGGNAVFIAIAMSCAVSVARINDFAIANLNIAGPVEELNHSATLYIDYLPTVNLTTNTDSSFNNNYSHIPASSQEGVEISDIISHTPDLSFKVSNVTKETTITIPRIYYIGYKIELQYADGSKERVPYIMSEYGFISFSVNKDTKVVINYPGTTLQRVSYWIAGGTIVVVLGTSCYIYVRGRKTTKKQPKQIAKSK